MAASDIAPVPDTRFEETLESASPDLLREAWPSRSAHLRSACAAN
jgi:hypothetical protein